MKTCLQNTVASYSVLVPFSNLHFIISGFNHLDGILPIVTGIRVVHRARYTVLLVPCTPTPQRGGGVHGTNDKVYPGTDVP